MICAAENGQFRSWVGASVVPGQRGVIYFTKTSVPTIYGGDFTDVWQLRDNVWAICPEMQTFRLRLYDRSGNDFFYVTPFQPSQYFVSVHPSASLVFTNTLHQMLVLQAIVHGCQLHNASPRYWLGPNYTMILEEWGRWRSQCGLEWIAAFGFSRVPPCIVSEMIQLCQEAGVLHVEDIWFCLHLLVSLEGRNGGAQSGCLLVALFPVLWPHAFSSLLSLLACFGSSCFVWSLFWFAFLFLCCFGTCCLPVLGSSAFPFSILIGCSYSCGCFVFHHLPPLTIILAPAVDQVRRWCYGTSSVLSTILVTHAAGSVAWPAGVHSALETIQWDRGSADFQAMHNEVVDALHPRRTLWGSARFWKLSSWRSNSAVNSPIPWRVLELLHILRHFEWKYWKGRWETGWIRTWTLFLMVWSPLGMSWPSSGPQQK